MKTLYFILFICLGQFFPHARATNTPAASTYQFKGEHFLASYLDCDKEAMADLDALEKTMLRAVELSGATVLNTSSWRFPPNGLTMVILLSESHASIHTYPEHNACFVDLFTCGEKCYSLKFDEVMRAYLKPQSVSERTLTRGCDIEEKPCCLKIGEMREGS